MNKLFSICFFCLLVFHTSAQEIIENDNNNIDSVKKEDSIIAQVEKSNTPPKKDKAQEISQLTKYGFKSLFLDYSYNPSLPYTAQINPSAESFMQDYIKAHNNSLQKMKGWGLPYFNLIESILQQYGLPKELKYVAVIESSLQSNVVSTKGACGPWQLMPGTAKTLGLSINSYVDERTDYYKSTHAASKYLLQLYEQLHDWLLVMAAYNGGLGRVNAAIKKSGSTDFWKLQYYLPEESRTYVKDFWQHSILWMGLVALPSPQIVLIIPLLVYTMPIRIYHPPNLLICKNLLFPADIILLLLRKISACPLQILTGIIHTSIK